MDALSLGDRSQWQRREHDANRACALRDAQRQFADGHDWGTLGQDYRESLLREYATAECHALTVEQREAETESEVCRYTSTRFRNGPGGLRDIIPTGEAEDVSIDKLSTDSSMFDKLMVVSGGVVMPSRFDGDPAHLIRRK